MARVPSGIDLPQISAALRDLDGVVAVHDEHGWTITTGFVAFAAHIEVAPGADAVAVVADARALLRDRFGIEHVTIQPEAAAVHDLVDTAA
jgi:cobalt-zinc-cadmium efflux system protein